ncbi:DUF2141 domain-containing protein [Thermoflavifilum thermophilum]|uniref:Uncharacterized conserved protein, DUF2141 family n=1 Tax=Thermoflavifilum thermophilum TaxID=1393122 RepID=A0A1I7N229_9BACT|nr:DUF2141 domain-containing protein [Thermoflavifilum thermophilum]SFV28616.1 Uncharacterized conserved protein, DUF2141 family [Thermoflavifilum thermophilum]
MLPVQAKYRKLSLLLFSGLCLHLHVHAQFQLRIQVEGLRNHKGQLLLSLFNQADGFPDQPAKSFRQMKIALHASQQPEGTWQNLPAGLYAIALLHDEDADSRFRVNWLGIPTEGVGVSTSKKMLWGKPNFQSSSFYLHHDTTIVIRVHYFL